jgi:hypothetical protein
MKSSRLAWVKAQAWMSMTSMALACSDSAAPEAKAPEVAVTPAPEAAARAPENTPAPTAPEPASVNKGDAAVREPGAMAARDASAGLDAPMAAPIPAAPSDAGSTVAGPCAAREVAGPAGVYFHHIHFNSTDPEADLAFYESSFDAPAVDFCAPVDSGAPTRAPQTDRGYFLFTQVDQQPDPQLNTYLEHVGWLNPDPVGELERQVMLGAKLFPEGRGQCETAFAGTMPCNDYWFYLQAPNGARIEIAIGPGPATEGFGHVHIMMGDDYSFFETVAGGRLTGGAIDMVNLTDVLEDESYLDGLMVVETRGKPIDHLGYSTVDLMAERERVIAAGLEIAEDISFKPEYGFRSFFMKSPKGIWVELVEDSPFAP